MNIIKHTCGPWKACNELHTTGYHVRGPNGYCIADVSAIANLNARALDEVNARVKENANLIAAAPDMYEAISTLIPILLDELEKRELCGDVNCEYVQTLQNAYEKAFNAMVKATLC